MPTLYEQAKESPFKLKDFHDDGGFVTFKFERQGEVTSSDDAQVGLFTETTTIVPVEYTELAVPTWLLYVILRAGIETAKEYRV